MKKSFWYPDTNTVPQLKVVIKRKFVQHYNDKRMGNFKMNRDCSQRFLDCRGKSKKAIVLA